MRSRVARLIRERVTSVVTLSQLILIMASGEWCVLRIECRVVDGITFPLSFRPKDTSWDTPGTFS